MKADSQVSSSSSTSRDGDGGRGGTFNSGLIVWINDNVSAVWKVMVNDIFKELKKLILKFIISSKSLMHLRWI
jgi:hypothetical protein